ncbi:MAG: hypothetical protein NTZ33_05165 [Bacteroidetes bacterium]|nr:hypothetical protein [Bacteroidota bacterium]
MKSNIESKFSAKEYWDNNIKEWIKWRKENGGQDNFPWKGWIFPKDKVINSKWKWGNHDHSSNLLPEPYWGNSIDPSVVFLNINPGSVNNNKSNQSLIKEIEKFTYFDIAASNKLNLFATQNFHKARFEWASMINKNIKSDKGLCIELIPWHSKSSSVVTNYIIDNRKSIFENIMRFQPILPKNGIFKNTFIVRSASFMDLLDKEDFSEKFDLKTLKHFILAKTNHIDKPISFLSIVFLKKKYKYSKFLIFHGGANNNMPSLNYTVLETNKKLKEFLNMNN